MKLWKKKRKKCMGERSVTAAKIISQHRFMRHYDHIKRKKIIKYKSMNERKKRICINNNRV